ncbi:RNA-binding protein 47-like [Paramacrobiotus metropolitanus]|uniref:RNA-binding protein 47-like n=1 Tax=Paramacrobiotus metropolitanus TaxID=2943436 RepID=UPI0024464060|nr:RNA-binding protein 47-like [Paramacrobiotus metropolitanus]
MHDIMVDSTATTNPAPMAGAAHSRNSQHMPTRAPHNTRYNNPPLTRYNNSNNPTPAIHRSQEDVDGVLSKLKNDTGCTVEYEPNLRRVLFPMEAATGDSLRKMSQRGCEVFLGRLPQDLLEDEIFAFCKESGRIREVRLMLLPNGIGNHMDGALNRGFAFVVFTRPEEAKRAIQTLDRKEIRPGHKIGVRRSVDNCRLFMGGLPRDKTKEEFEAEIRTIPTICTSTLQRVIMYPSVQDKTKNRGFAFVEFASHRDAAIVRRQLMRDRVALWGKDICVDWAQPEAEVDQDVMDKVRIVYVRNLQVNTSEETLYEIFSGVARNGNIEKVKKLKDFAFVHYQDRKDAEAAVSELNGLDVDGSPIEVTLAKPPSTKLKSQQPDQTAHPDLRRRVMWDIPPNQQWNHNPIYRPVGYNSGGYFPVDLAQMHYFNMANNQQTMPVFGRGPLPQQRHYRNAAGTRKRFAVPNGMHTPEYRESGEVSPLGMNYTNGMGEAYAQFPLPDAVPGYPHYYPQHVLFAPQINPAHPQPSGMFHSPHSPQHPNINEMVSQLCVQMPCMTITNGMPHSGPTGDVQAQGGPTEFNNFHQA